MRAKKSKMGKNRKTESHSVEFEHVIRFIRLLCNIGEIRCEMILSGDPFELNFLNCGRNSRSTVKVLRGQWKEKSPNTQKSKRCSNSTLQCHAVINE